MIRLGLISDTHNRTHPAVFERFAGVDAILHGGDIGDEDIITALETVAPVHAVHGNTDLFAMRQRHPEWRMLEFGGVRIFITHILQPFKLAEIDRLLAAAGEKHRPDVLIYGHTHEDRIEKLGPVLTVNPGSAGPPRFHLRPSVAFLTIAPDGRLEAWVERLEGAK